MVKRSTTKKRGSRMHGRGKKRGRGAGLRGGRGHSGSMSHKFIHYNKYNPEHFDHRHGFTRPQAVIDEDEVLNVGDLDDLVETFLDEGVAHEEDGATIVDLASAGFDKLLGAGKVRTGITVKVPKATSKAVEKIEAAGGSVETTE